MKPSIILLSALSALAAVVAVAVPTPDDITTTTTTPEAIPATVEQSPADIAPRDGSFDIIVWKELDFGRDCGYPATSYVLPTYSNVCYEFKFDANGNLADAIQSVQTLGHTCNFFVNNNCYGPMLSICGENADVGSYRNAFTSYICW